MTNLNFFYVFFRIVFIHYSSSFFLASASGSKAEGEAAYGYAIGTSNGPENWGNLKPEWKACGDGKQQSPIDLIDKRVQELPQLGQLGHNYNPASAVLKNRGHDITLEWKGDAGQIHVNGTHYKLINCHWHTPSEHTLNGIKFDLEMHIVNRNAEGQTAAIGVWYTIGSPDPFLSKLLNAIKTIRDKDIDLGVIHPGLINFGSNEYYRYFGSLTTPPCTEGVVWTIMKKVRTVSTEQLEALKRAVHHGYEENARPTQETKERQVWLYTPEHEQEQEHEY